MKKAFSLIEVIFVLVILGIVASISSQIIVQVYENYITQKALYQVTTKTEIAATQIVNRLSFAIDGTTVTKRPHTTSYTEPYTASSIGINWVRLNDIDINNDDHKKFTTIEWIGYDNDSFSASAVPYWTGLGNYDIASRNYFITPGSNLSKAANIIKSLSQYKGTSKVDLTKDKPAAIIFSEEDNEYLPNQTYSPMCMGIIDESNTSCIFPVKIGTPFGAGNDNNLTFTREDEAKIITERYKLAWSAYAIVPEDKDGDSLFDLYLYYNYQPWNNEKYADDEGNPLVQRSLLINNVSVFKFTENGGVIQLKLCATEKIGNDVNITSCKEKAIIR
jgi:prepilin-type N-terminal cleavage/methylation domain-containing protein